MKTTVKCESPLGDSFFAVFSTEPPALSAPAALSVLSALFAIAALSALVAFASLSTNRLGRTDDLWNIVRIYPF